MISLTAARSNDAARCAYLEELVQETRPRIHAVMRSMVGNKVARDHADEAEQAFLRTANVALDSARTEDDGRGKNDPRAWCKWRGLNAVRDFARETMIRVDRAPQKSEFAGKVVYAEDLRNQRAGDSGLRDHNEWAPPDPVDYADEVVAQITAQDFLRTLEPQERDIALLLMYGENEKTKLLCVCPRGAFKHSIVRDIAAAVDCTETTVWNVMARLRKKAAKVYGRS